MQQHEEAEVSAASFCCQLRLHVVVRKAHDVQSKD
jgi:hypothetical protein